MVAHCQHLLLLIQRDRYLFPLPEVEEEGNRGLINIGTNPYLTFPLYLWLRGRRNGSSGHCASPPSPLP
jgi:hypothetical protein